MNGQMCKSKVFQWMYQNWTRTRK